MGLITNTQTFGSHIFVPYVKNIGKIIPSFVNQYVKVNGASSSTKDFPFNNSLNV